VILFTRPSSCITTSMIINKETFGKFLLNARTQSGLSQLALARELGYTSPQYVSNWERGVCGPPLDKLNDLSRLLRIDSKVVMKMILDDTEAYLRKELRLDAVSFS
jgi:transcriptional regulator with XRE-family HTH domain